MRLKRYKMKCDGSPVYVDLDRVDLVFKAEGGGVLMKSRSSTLVVDETLDQVAKDWQGSSADRAPQSDIVAKATPGGYVRGGIYYPSETTPGVETQESVSSWRLETFGQAKPPEAVAMRMAEEVGELLEALGYGSSVAQAVARCKESYVEPIRLPSDAALIPSELADVQVLLWGAASALGVDLGAATDEKMKVNRARRWNKDGRGGGQHVPTRSFSGIAQALRAMMGEDMVARLRGIRDSFGGKLNVLIEPKELGAIPYPVHFREGMAVRNALRRIPESMGWSANDYDDRWEAIALEAIR